MLSNTQMDAAASSPLFRGLEREEIARLLEELKIHPVAVPKNAILIEQGEKRSSIHIVLSGAAVGERLGAEGQSVIINEFGAGSIFGDMLSGGEEKSPVAVRVTAEGFVLRIPFSALLTQSEGCAAAREAVLRNLFREISQKYFALMRRMDMLLCPSLRGKIALYILETSRGQSRFAAPHSREQQAAILSCDRSALSRELSRMRREKIISFSGAHFEILDRERLLRLGSGEKDSG